MPYIDAGQSRLYYEVTGEGPPLVLAHGVGGNHASWFEQLSALSARYQVITWDHRGFGRSTDVEGLGRAKFAEDLGQVLDGLAIERCVLVGQSMGGGTCLAYTCAHPERVAGLVMADSLSAAALPVQVAERMKALELETADLSQAERVLGATFRRERPSAVALYGQIAGFNAVNLRTLQGKMKTHSASDLAATGVPSLFIVGEEDVLFPPWAVRAYRALVPGSRYVELARTGHSAFFERPDAFNAALETWLTDLGYAA